VLLVVLVGLVIGVAGAGADASDPVVASTTGTVTTNADGSRTVTVNGAWAWTTHKSDCSQDKRAVGFAVDWNDPSAPGNVVATLDGQTIDVGVAATNQYNAADNLVHPAQPGTNTPDANAWRGGCGAFNGQYNTGTWGPISHTYAPTFSGPITICALMYDVHLKQNAGAPNNDKEIAAGGKQHNGDNSAESNKNTPLGNGCFATTIPGGPTGGGPANPALSIVKYQRNGVTGGPFVHSTVGIPVGQLVQYQIVVTNTGNIAETVNLADARCDPGTITITDGHATIAPGEHVTYECTHKVVAGDGSAVTNVAIATATAANGASVGPAQSQVTANVQAATTPAQAPKGVLGASKTVKKVTKQAKPARAKVKAARFTG
jgi:hypothetical protein